MFQNYDLYKNIMKQTFFIASSRLLILLVPTVCLSLLSNNNITSVGNFSVSSQYIQILIVIMISLNIGTNIILSRNKGSVRYFLKSVMLMLYISLFLSTLFFIVSLYTFEKDVHCINIVFLIGIPFVSINLVMSSLLESYQKTVFSTYISALSLVLTLIICLLVSELHLSNNLFISSIITAIRIVQCIVTYLVVFKLFHVKFRINRLSIDKPFIREVMSFGIPEMITSVTFTGSIFFSFYYLSLMGVSVDYLGISFSYKNLISIIFLSFCIAYSISLSNNPSIKFGSGIIISIFFYSAVYFFMYISTELVSRLFNHTFFLEISEYLYLSQLIVLFDAIGMLIVFHLRINDIKTIPSLLRLSFPLIGVPLGIILANKYDNDYYFMYGILLGNAIFMMTAIVYYLLILIKNCRV